MTSLRWVIYSSTSIQATICTVTTRRQFCLQDANSYLTRDHDHITVFPISFNGSKRCGNKIQTSLCAHKFCSNNVKKEKEKRLFPQFLHVTGWISQLFEEGGKVMQRIYYISRRNQFYLSTVPPPDTLCCVDQSTAWLILWWSALIYFSVCSLPHLLAANFDIFHLSTATKPDCTWALYFYARTQQ